METTDSLDPAVDLGRRIKAARALAGKTVAEIASACGWTIQKVYRFESGAQVPNAIDLGAIAAVTGQTVGWLLGTSSESAGADGSLTEAQPVENVKDEEAA